MNSRHGPRAGQPRRNRWFLAAAILLEAAWIVFLTVLVIMR
jgi:hypothetical protein